MTNLTYPDEYVRLLLPGDTVSYLGKEVEISNVDVADNTCPIAVERRWVTMEGVEIPDETKRILARRSVTAFVQALPEEDFDTNMVYLIEVMKGMTE